MATRQSRSQSARNGPAKLVARKSVAPSNPAQHVAAHPVTPTTQPANRTDARQNGAHQSQLFDWDDLALGVNISSDSSSDSSPSRPSKRPSPSRSFPPRPNREWTRFLTELRKLRRRAKPYRPQAQRWLDTQLESLRDGTLPATLKCVLSASDVSPTFTRYRTDFMRKEYRKRYWEWALQFVALIDYTIGHGDVNKVTSNASKFPQLVAFVKNSQTQHLEGSLTPHKEELLLSLGLKWQPLTLHEPETEEHDGQSNSTEENSKEETYKQKGRGLKETGEKTVASLRPKRSRTKSTPAPSSSASAAPVAEVADENLHASSNVYATQDSNVIKEWSRRFIELREYFQKPDNYDIPPNIPYLKIWMNTEIARMSTGTLSVYCCGVLLAGDVVESVKPVQITIECDKWCRGFTEYVDYILLSRKSAPETPPIPLTLAKFLHSCRLEARGRSLSSAKAALLKGVDENWQHSATVRSSSQTIRDRQSTGLGIDALLGGVMEDVDIDYGQFVDEEGPARKRRRQSEAICQRMVSSMIKGMVAEGFAGRRRTADERMAEEWVARAGVRALNSYAQNWYHSVTGSNE